jgi:hypothetical protein
MSPPFFCGKIYNVIYYKRRQKSTGKRLRTDGINEGLARMKRLHKK